MLRYICGRSRYYWDTIAKITKYCCNSFADITKFTEIQLQRELDITADTFGDRIKYYWDISAEGVDITEIQLWK